MKSAILLSGGLDSIALCDWTRPSHAITIDYGQVSARGEIRAATKVAELLEIEHCVLSVDCKMFGSGDLAGNRPLDIAPAQEWWPFRNQMLITFAAMKAISFDVKTLMVGTVKSDSFHKDGTEEFIQAINSLVSLQEGAISITAPAIEYTTSELITKTGTPLKLLGWAHSCHKYEWACGLCRGCTKHRLVMQELGYDSY